MSLFVWLLPFDLSGLSDPTSSYATAGIALRVSEARKLPHHVKVETPSGENLQLSVIINRKLLVWFKTQGATRAFLKNICGHLFFFISNLIHCFSVYVQYLLSYFLLHVSGLTDPSSGGLNCTCSLWYSPPLQTSLAGQRHLQRGRIP